MSSLTAKQRAGQEAIKKKIVDAHRRGTCDRNGNPIPTRTYGSGALSSGLVTIGTQRLNVWQRDDRGCLIGDD